MVIVMAQEIRERVDLTESDVPEEEARRVYSQATAYLGNFAEQNQIVLIVTCPPHQETRRNNFLHALTYGRANTVISLKQTRYESEFILEKHPLLTSGVAKFPYENFALTDFIEA